MFLKGLVPGSIPFLGSLFDNPAAVKSWTTDQQCQFWHPQLPASIVFSKDVRLLEAVPTAAKVPNQDSRVLSFQCIQITPAFCNVAKRQWGAFKVLPRSMTNINKQKPDLNCVACDKGYEPALIPNVDLGHCVPERPKQKKQSEFRASTSGSLPECDLDPSGDVHWYNREKPKKCKMEYRTPEIQVLEQTFIPQTFGVTEMFCLDHKPS